MNKLQSGPPRHGQILTMTEIKMRAFFFRGNLVAPDMPTISHTYKRCYCFLIPITSRGCPVFRVVSCHDLLCQDWVICTRFRQETKELQNVHSQSPSTLTRIPTTLAFFNGVSWSLCALFHMKPRGSFTATVLTESETLPERSADTSIFTAFCLPSGGVFR